MMKMATKSFLREIIIKNKKSAEKFIDALENAENKKAKKVKINKMVQDVTDCEQIRKIFNQK
jgi:hypothetical protein